MIQILYFCKFIKTYLFQLLTLNIIFIIWFCCISTIIKNKQLKSNMFVKINNKNKVIPLRI